MKETSKQPVASISFDEVVVTDALAWTLFGLAQREGLLYARSGQDFSGRPPTARDRQAALSLLVLFDKLVLHDLSPSSSGFRLPDLEREGFLEIVSAVEPLAKASPIKSAWKPTKSDPRRKPSLSLRRDLALLEFYKPLIIDRLMSISGLDFDISMARTLGISRRDYYNQFLNLAIGYAAGDSASLHGNLIVRALPRNFLSKITSELFDFQKRGELLGPTNAILAVALVFANELGVIQELSRARGLGVATRYYTGISRSSHRGVDPFSVDPAQVPKSFGLVRSILHEEGHFFPSIENIAHALELRRNPHLTAFREQFREFHIQLARGDRETLGKVRNEVRRARRALERTGKWSLPLRWLTYISLPATVAESALGGAPIVGASLAVMSAVGTAATARAYRRNQWVLFGV